MGCKRGLHFCFVLSGVSFLRLCGRSRSTGFNAGVSCPATCDSCATRFDLERIMWGSAYHVKPESLSVYCEEQFEAALPAKNPTSRKNTELDQEGSGGLPRTGFPFPRVAAFPFWINKAMIHSLSEIIIHKYFGLMQTIRQLFKFY